MLLLSIFNEFGFYSAFTSFTIWLLPDLSN
jgi:hypothetical protein